MKKRAVLRESQFHDEMSCDSLIEAVWILIHDIPT